MILATLPQTNRAAVHFQVLQELLVPQYVRRISLVIFLSGTLPKYLALMNALGGSTFSDESKDKNPTVTRPKWLPTKLKLKYMLSSHVIPDPERDIQDSPELHASGSTGHHNRISAISGRSQHTPVSFAISC
jgi:hypothetical protein